ncbi:MAG: 50S ribosomal protein L28 [Candidatus Calescibacterium sp.]|nr:50S ribosomal protein L28 [Candidatus Calescibacterium sp.]MDW8132207.1 50S ribosomal protein L28 [Candidatus Calescibacterium sp.]
MSRVCYLSGKKTVTGFAVSHSNRHTKRKWKVNLRKVRVGDKVIKVSAKYLRKFGVILKSGNMNI